MTLSPWKYVCISILVSFVIFSVPIFNTFPFQNKLSLERWSLLNLLTEGNSWWNLNINYVNIRYLKKCWFFNTSLVSLSPKNKERKESTEVKRRTGRRKEKDENKKWWTVSALKLKWALEPLQKHRPDREALRLPTHQPKAAQGSGPSRHLPVLQSHTPASDTVSPYHTWFWWHRILATCNLGTK